MTIKITTILFDLDGTLLPLDPDQFVKIYFHQIAQKFAPKGYDPQTFIKAVWMGTEAMIKNDGKQTNEVTFWQTFKSIIKGDYQDLENTFLDFYQNEYDETKNSSSYHVLAKKCIDILKQKGYQLVLATNPLFPQVATYKRIEWAGLDSKDFIHITTYENSSYCKPNIKYYLEILKLIEKDASCCLMVGNDVNEDMVVTELGMDTFLLTDCLINPKNVDINQFPHGDFEAFLRFVKSLPDLNQND